MRLLREHRRGGFRVRATSGRDLLAAGIGVLAVAGATGQWTPLVVAVPLVGLGIAALVDGEATSWLRGDIDERRKAAVDHGFRRPSSSWPPGWRR
jgi:hypothetical protein